MISVLIRTRQRAGRLDCARTAVGRQRLPSGLEWDIVVAKNNCTDETPEVVRRHAQATPRGVRQILENRPDANSLGRQLDFFWGLGLFGERYRRRHERGAAGG